MKADSKSSGLVAAVSRPLEGFRSHHENWFVPGDCDSPPALTINPAASSEALVAAAQSRVSRLENQLALLSQAGWDMDAVKLEQVCAPLWALAQEATLLLDAVVTKRERGNG